MKRASIIFIERNGLVLAVSRKYDFSNLGLPGGKLDEDEEPASGAEREFLEEVGHPLTSCTFIESYVHPDDGFLVYLFAGESDVPNDIKFGPEGTRVEFVGIDDLCSPASSFCGFNTAHIKPIVCGKPTNE
jgi:8-oxo-dGTP pyrophosphatase MutT (NUDIX family)